MKFNNSITGLQILFVIGMVMFILFLARNQKRLPLIVAIGFAFRIVLAVLDGADWMTIPWSGQDSYAFYKNTLMLANEPFSRSISYVPVGSGYLMFPWAMSWFVRIFDSDYLFLVLINVLLGTYQIVQASRLGNLFLEPKQSRLLAWAVAIYPVNILLSAVFIRELIIIVCVTETFIRIGHFIKNRSFPNAIFACVLIMIAAFFHGGMIICIFAFPVAFVFAQVLSGHDSGGQSTASFVALLLFSLICVAGTLAVAPQLSKLGNISDVEALSEKVSSRVELESRRTVSFGGDYPVYLAYNIYRPDIAAIRYCYFLFAPFPWDAPRLTDLVASVFGTINFLIVLLIIKNFRRLKTAPLTFFLMFAIVTLAFSAGTANVGTAIRHRNKAMVGLLCAGVAALYEERKRWVSK